MIVDQQPSPRTFLWGQRGRLSFYQREYWAGLQAVGVADLRNVEPGSLPDGEGFLEIKKGIEVGHIFQQATNQAPMKASVLNGEPGTDHVGWAATGCAAIEQNNDIIWPESIAPFTAVPIPVATHKVVRDTTSAHDELIGLGVDVLLDDRDSVRPGAEFAEAELIGIPHRIVIGKGPLPMRKSSTPAEQAGNPRAGLSRAPLQNKRRY